MSTPERAVVVHPDGDSVASATAARLLLALLDAQAVRPVVHVALTGGTVGTKTLAAIAGSELRSLIDWTAVHLWWGDERFVEAGSDDRNERQAREALIDTLPIPAANVHPFPATDSPGVDGDLEVAVERFATELAEFGADPDAAEAPGWPVFDVTLLGVGPDGHVASLFPGHDSLAVTGVAVVAEPDSPKPPPRRLSLTLPAINSSRQVWLVVAGQDKAEAVASALGGSDLPAAQVHGTDVTLWLLDVAAAGR